MKKILVTTLISFVATTSTFAFPVFAKPEKCPSLSAVAKAGISAENMSELSAGQWVLAHESNTYDTKEQWGFSLGYFFAQDKQTAYQKALYQFGALQFAEGPILVQDRWVCRYPNDQDYTASAIFPPYTE